jgi:glycosyltransferase involved in cell wall biosynthesis
MKGVEEVNLLTGLFSIIMGGHYYISRSPKRKLRVTLYRSGVDLIDKLVSVTYFKNNALMNVIQKQYNYSIIHLNTTEYLNVFAKLKIPKLFVLHGSPDYVDERGCRALENVYAKVDAFVTVSFHAARVLRERCGFEPTHTIHHGIDVELFNPLICSKNQAKRLLRLPLDKKTVLWSARLSPEKKIETLLYALPYAVKEVKDVLVIIKIRVVVKDLYHCIFSGNTLLCRLFTFPQLLSIA